MHTFFTDWLLLLAIFTVALASPGPDFVMAVRNSVMGSRKAGIFTAIGFGLGVAVHVLYCLAGLALVISQSILLFTIIKWVGAAYLFYVGVKAIRSQGFSEDGEEGAATSSVMRQQITPLQALRSGFITNLFNPKATLFFLALFTQVIRPDALFVEKAVYGLTCIVMTMIWFSLVATVLMAPKIKAGFLKLSKWIDRVCGALFIGLGIKLALTRL